MGLLPDTWYCGFARAPRMPGTFPRHHGLTIPTCITARASRTCRDACRYRYPAVSFKSVAGKTFPAFAAHAQPAILRIWWETHCQVLRMRTPTMSARFHRNSSYMVYNCRWVRQWWSKCEPSFAQTVSCISLCGQMTTRPIMQLNKCYKASKTLRLLIRDMEAGLWFINVVHIMVVNCVI